MRLGRRTLLGAASGAAAAAAGRAQGGAALTLATDLRAPIGEFRAEEHGIVGVYDADWLTDPRYTRMLDHMAASPGAFSAVRFFGALNAGTREQDFPTNPGATWTDPAAEPDFRAGLDSIAPLVARGFTPFVALTFFPPAVSRSPIQPPADLSRWQRLVRGWLAACADRFGQEEVARWWLEVWNEPNMPQFWSGSWEDYFRLYRATCDAARATGLRLRLGGPAMAWLPAPDIPGQMEGFLRFLAANPDLPCDFVSYHRKGIWDAATESEPEVARLVEAAETTAELALRILPERCARGLLLVNNEADMRVGFQRPYGPRLTERFPSWHAAVAVAHERLNGKYGARGLRFLAAGDNANQHLVRGPFDGRRALLTPAAADRPDDLIKLPVFHVFEMFRAQGPRLLAAEERDGLFALATMGEGRVAAMATLHRPGPPAELVWEIANISWPRSELRLFRVDGALSNSFAANGSRSPSPPLSEGEVARLRAAAELAEDRPSRRGLDTADGRLSVRVELAPHASVLALVFPSDPRPPPVPAGLEVVPAGRDVVLRWGAPPPAPGEGAPPALGYEVFRLDLTRLLAPSPLLARMWVDTAPPRGESLVYGVRAVSPSGVRSALVTARAIRL